MMHHHQQRQSSTFLRSLNSRNSGVSLSNDCSSSTSASSSCSVLLSVFAWSVMLLLIFSCLDIADARELTGHRLGKRSFELQCKGTFDASIFARLHRICDDCFNTFHEPQVYTLCMDNCFTSKYFKECIDVLLLQDKIPEIKQWIRQIHRPEPLV